MDFIIINHFTIALFSALLLIAALQDLVDYRIPNTVIVALIALYPVYLLTTPSDVSWLISLGISGAFFLVGVGLFSIGVMGGGDVKLIAVTSLWMGVIGLVPFILIMGIVGGAMSLFMLSPLRAPTAYLCGRLGLVSVKEKILTDKLAYGVAISAGGLFGAYKLVVMG